MKRKKEIMLVVNPMIKLWKELVLRTKQQPRKRGLLHYSIGGKQ